MACVSENSVGLPSLIHIRELNRGCFVPISWLDALPIRLSFVLLLAVRLPIKAEDTLHKSSVTSTLKQNEDSFGD